MKILARVAAYLGILFGGFLLVTAFAMHIAGNAHRPSAGVIAFVGILGAGAFVGGIGLILGDEFPGPVSLEGIGAGYLAALKDACQAASLLVRGEADWDVMTRDLFGALIRGESNKLSFVRIFAIKYAVLGPLIFWLIYHFMFYIVTTAVCWTAVCLILAMTGLVFGGLYRNRGPLAPTEGEWAGSALAFAAAMFLSVYYFLFLNAILSPGGEIRYSGIVEKKKVEVWDAFAGTSRRTFGMLFFNIFIGRTEYNLYLRDAATKERIKMEVSEDDYANFHEGGRFSKTFRRGLFGIPYRWALWGE